MYVCDAVQDVRVGAVFPDCVAECMGLGPIWPEPVSGGGETPPHLPGSPGPRRPLAQPAGSGGYLTTVM